MKRIFYRLQEVLVLFAFAQAIRGLVQIGVDFAEARRNKLKYN